MTQRSIVSAMAGLVAASLLCSAGCERSRPSKVPTTGASLFGAAVDNDVEEAKRAIAQGADIDQVDRRSRATPLYVAAHSGSLEVAQLLIEHGADVEETSPISAAASRNSLDVARLLLENGADPNEPCPVTRRLPFHSSARSTIR